MDKAPLTDLTESDNLIQQGLDLILKCEKLRSALPWRKSCFSDNIEQAKKLFEYLKGCLTDEA